MIRGPTQLLQTLAQDAKEAARAMLRRGLIVGLALLIGSVGLGFLLFAVWDTLRLALGAGMAALVIGAGLLVASASLVLIAGRAARPRHPRAQAKPSPDQPPNPLLGSESAAMAAFTAAFVIGRLLANRGRR